jgi:hypothetical protein
VGWFFVVVCLKLDEGEGPFGRADVELVFELAVGDACSLVLYFPFPEDLEVVIDEPNEDFLGGTLDVIVGDAIFVKSLALHDFT